MSRISSGAIAVIAIAVFLATLATPSQTQAALIWDFVVTGDSLSGSGHIEFTTESSETGIVSDFSYEGAVDSHDWSCFGTGCFDADPIWEINGDWVFTALDLWIQTVESEYTYTLGIEYDGEWLATGTFRNGVSLPPVIGVPVFSHAEIPEPATFALFAIGLAGFGVLMRRRRKQSQVA